MPNAHPNDTVPAPSPVTASGTRTGAPPADLARGPAGPETVPASGATRAAGNGSHPGPDASHPGNPAGAPSAPPGPVTDPSTLPPVLPGGTAGPRARVVRTEFGRMLRVQLGTRSYDILVGSGLLAQVGARMQAAVPAGTAALIADEGADALFGDEVAASLKSAGFDAARITFPAGEQSKGLAALSALYDKLFAHGLDRGSPLVALGGGVAGDLVGFAAATFKRGVPFVQLPTTLLAMVDAAVGGKTGINHAAGKNLIGAVHQPSLVVADVDTLRKLPAGEFASGLAEVVKHALIADPLLFDWLETHADRITGRDPGDRRWADLMSELVAWNCAIKAAVVEFDERETGPRTILNYGHTVGHALEAVCGWGLLRHGHAVAIGMQAEAAIAVDRGWVKADLLDRQGRLLERLGLPVRLPDDARKVADLESAMTIARQDKKFRGGRVTMVLPEALGSVKSVTDVTEAEIRTAMRRAVGEAV